MIANIEPVANLFITKTVYAALLAAAIVVGAEPYPFFPRLLTIVDTLTIRVPGSPRLRIGSTARRFRFHTTCAALYPSGRNDYRSRNLRQLSHSTGLALHDLGSSQDGSAAGRVRHGDVGLGPDWSPFNPARVILVVSMAAAFVVLFSISLSCRVFALHLPPTADCCDRRRRRDGDRSSYALAPHQCRCSGS